MLAIINNKTINLYKASGFTASTWGHSVCGLTAKEVEAIERDALACSGFLKPGRCRITSLVLQYGAATTPVARILKETTFAWFDCLRTCLGFGQIHNLRASWSKAY